jgi:multiple sugar transport system substrate-binding protein
MEQDEKFPQLTRRAFLRAAMTGASAALLAACGGTSTPEPATNSGTGAAAPTSAPAAEAATSAPAAAAATSAPAAEAATSAPAAASGSNGKFVVLQRQEYFQAVETKFRQEVTDFAKSKGADLDISTVNPESFGDFTAKMQAAVQAGNPPDLAYQTNVSPQQLYFLDTLEDVTDVVDELVKMYGEIVPPTAAMNAKIDGKWWAVPFFSQTGSWFARKDAFEAAGIDYNTLDTMDQRRDAALKISDPAKEMWGWGMTVNKSGDGNGLIITAIQAFGGHVVDDSGKKVTFNSPETVKAVQWLAEIYSSDKYKPMLPPGVGSWTDTSNNEAYLAGKVGMTVNQLSVYAKAKQDKNPVLEKTALMQFPVDPQGVRLGGGASGWFHIFKGAKNVDLAKEAILYLVKPENLIPLVQEGGGLVLPAYKNQWTDDVLKIDPNFPTLQKIIFESTKYTGFSYPAQPNPATAAAEASGFQSEMMSNVISGKMTAEQAVKDATDKIVRIFEELGLPQS